MSAAAGEAAPGPARTWLIRLVLLLGVVMLALAIGELATRLLVPEAIWRTHDDNADWRFDAETGWVHLPDLDVSRSRDGRLIRFQTNADGLTPPTAKRERSPGVQRVLLFGDSAVLGRWVPQDETLNAHLERVLRARGVAAEVFNAGIEGYATDQALLLMQRLAPLYRPDVITFGLHPNDFGGVVAREAYRNAKPMFELGADGELRVQPPTPRERRIQPRGGAPRLRGAIQHSALYRLIQPFVYRVRAQLSGWEQAWMIGLDQDAMYYDAAVLERFDWRLMGALIGRMREVAEENGAQFLLYEHPDVGAVWEPYIELQQRGLGVEPARWDRHAFERRVAAEAGSHGVQFAPTVDYFVARQSRGPFHLLPRDFHCNPAGYEVTAELLAERLIESGWLRPTGDGLASDRQ
jgi:lysophospholipase L1-like esterase